MEFSIGDVYNYLRAIASNVSMGVGCLAIKRDSKTWLPLLACDPRSPSHKGSSAALGLTRQSSMSPLQLIT